MNDDRVFFCHHGTPLNDYCMRCDYEKSYISRHVAPMKPSDYENPYHVKDRVIKELGAECERLNRIVSQTSYDPDATYNEIKNLKAKLAAMTLDRDGWETNYNATYEWYVAALEREEKLVAALQQIYSTGQVPGDKPAYVIAREALENYEKTKGE